MMELLLILHVTYSSFWIPTTQIMDRTKWTSFVASAIPDITPAYFYQ
jgi:hypothetical protein